MKSQFLKVAPPVAIEKLEAVMVSGYQMIDKIRNEFSKTERQNIGNILENWYQYFENWENEALKILQEIYFPLSKAYYFKEAQTMRYLKVGDNEITGMENAFEIKVEILKQYLDFILNQSHPHITVNGNLNFQSGDNNNNEQS